MPEYQRPAYRFNFREVNLNVPIPAVPPGDYAVLQNVRSLEQGGLFCRPGQVFPFTGTMADLDVHSVRRLDDLAPGASPASCLVIGAGGTLLTQVGVND